MILLQSTLQTIMLSTDSWLSQQLEAHKTPSVQYAFFDTARTIHFYKSGMSDVATGVPVRESTTYNLFSITKTFTALAVLQLAQEDKLDLQSPAARYLHTFPYGGDVTVHQLLSHTAGIPNPLPLRWTHLSTEHAGFDSDGFFRGVFSRNNALKSLPGARFRYSNRLVLLRAKGSHSCSRSAKDSRSVRGAPRR